MINWLKKRQYRHPTTLWSPNKQTETKPFKEFRSNLIYPIGSIPGRPEAHASNIVAGPCSKELITLYTAWFCGTREGNLDVAIMFATITYTPKPNLDDIVFHYSQPKIIADLPDRAS
jgi:predicted neuraminidase